MTPLHQFGELLRNFLLAIPLGVARAFFVLLPLALLVWLWRLPAQHTRPPGRPPRAGENLKIWAGLALLIQVLIYLFL